MKKITAKALAQAAGGVLAHEGNEPVAEHISLDSRKMAGNDLFVPIIGERADGHDYICMAIGNGATVVFTSRHKTEEEVQEAILAQCKGDKEKETAAKAAAWICVPDTRKALQDFGAYCRRNNPIPLVGITGSVGKTTTREMVAAALSAGFLVYKTPGNSNSQVGVPITVAEIPENAEIGVIELGMSEPGEMTRIANVAQVNCAVMTNIGVAHIEQLGSQENILKEKLHIQDGMSEDGTFDVLPKKEVIALKKELDKLQKNLGGIKEMKKLPDAIFIVDPKKERICVQEAHTLGIPLIGIADTNCDPEELDYVIPGNDDAIRAVKLIVAKMADAVIEANQGEAQADFAEAEETTEA